jgi:hypothetical protein
MAIRIGLKRSKPVEYILDHRELAKRPDRSTSAEGNIHVFMKDVENGLLVPYERTFIAYQKGVLCGQSRNGKKLYGIASGYYGSSGLSVFKVPTRGKEASYIRSLESNSFGYVGDIKIEPKTRK